MSYTLFLLLNVNHEPDALIRHLAARLEQTGPNTFCLDHAPDSFFSVEYLHEGNDTSLCVDIPFGSEEAVLREMLDFNAYVEEHIQFQLLDPQLGKVIGKNEVQQIFAEWKKLNLEALQSYSDGHHFLRNIEERDGRKTMVEAIKYAEETWPNHCSVALAYARVGEAAVALRHFERALELDPGNPGILHALGVTHFNLKDYPTAKNILLQAVEADPANQTARGLLEDCNARLQSQ